MMKNGKMLITGVSGFLGGQLAVKASSDWDVSGTIFTRNPPESSALSVFCCDLTDRDSLSRLVEDLRPAVVVHAAAMTNSNECAKDPARATEINANVSGHLARISRDMGSRFISISTDLVFSGRRQWNEEKVDPEPVCWYGKTKYAGELAVLQADPHALILRTSLLYGWSVTSAKCFTETMIERLEQGHTIPLFTDEFRTPAWSGDACAVILACAAQPELAGIMHVAGPDRLSRYDFGLLLTAEYGFDPAILKATSVNDATFFDERPRDCSMNTDRLRTLFPDNCRGVADGLRAMRDRGSVSCSSH